MLKMHLQGLNPGQNTFFCAFDRLTRGGFILFFPVDDWMDVVKVCSFLIEN
jgi:hypothetical protein